MRVPLKTVGEKKFSRLLLFVVSFINKSYQNLSLCLFFVYYLSPQPDCPYMRAGNTSILFPEVPPG